MKDMTPIDETEAGHQKAEAVQLPLNLGEDASIERINVRQHHLPADVKAFEQTLVEAAQEAESVKQEADGMFLGIGLDGLIGLIPVAGALYSAWRGFCLLVIAQKIRASAGTSLFGGVLILFDILIGIWIGFGDVLDALFRSHAIFAGKIAGQAREKFLYIQALREIAQTQGLSPGELEAARDFLFRNGKSPLMASLPLIVFAGFVLMWWFG